MTGKETPEERRARLARAGTLGGFSRAAKLSPEERSRRARVAGLASAEARRLEREARCEEASKRSQWKHRSGPTTEELEPFLTEALRTDPTLSEYLARRQAIVLYKLYLAQIDVEGGAR